MRYLVLLIVLCACGPSPKPRTPCTDCGWNHSTPDIVLTPWEAPRGR